MAPWFGARKPNRKRQKWSIKHQKLASLHITGAIGSILKNIRLKNMLCETLVKAEILMGAHTLEITVDLSVDISELKV